MDTFVAIDVEIASRRPTAVCAIGAARYASGVEVASFASLVRFRGRPQYGRIHGLSRNELATAPEWPMVWRDLLALMDGESRIVAYRADFDRAAILTMCGRYGLRPPPLRFTCAARIAEARTGRSVDLAGALVALGIPFPGRAHDALSDARAAAAVVLACGGGPAEGRVPAM